ncbi:MAG: PD40 domain-containing protein, partial [Flavobacteriales bacterium]|nr:PD40 domain-containing protein [Flavobacteriales bacterium]
MNPLNRLAHLSFTALIGVAVSTASMAQPKEPFTYRKMLMLDRISALDVSPDGQYALFNFRGTDMGNNKGVNLLGVKNLADPAAPEVSLETSREGASSARWSPDGQWIYFLSSRGEEGTAQVWRTTRKGDMAEQMTRLPLDVESFRVTPDGKGFVLAMAVFPECGPDAVACTADRLAKRKADKATGTVYTKMFVRHWDTWSDGRVNRLFHVAMGEGQRPRPLMGTLVGDVPGKPWGDEGDYCISPDSKTVYFSMRRADAREPWSTNFDIFQVPLAGGNPANFTEGNPAWDAGPRISPDGKTMAYLAMKRPGFEADRFWINLMDLATGKTTTLAGDWDRSAEAIKWSRDGQSLFVTAQDLGCKRLFQVDVKTGKVTRRSKDGSIDAFFETANGFVFLKSSLNFPSQLFAAKPKAKLIDEGATKLLQFNKDLETLAFGTYEQFNFKGWNDETVHGYV